MLLHLLPQELASARPRAGDSRKLAHVLMKLEVGQGPPPSLPSRLIRTAELEGEEGLVHARVRDLQKRGLLFQQLAACRAELGGPGACFAIQHAAGRVGARSDHGDEAADCAGKLASLPRVDECDRSEGGGRVVPTQNSGTSDIHFCFPQGLYLYF